MSSPKDPAAALTFIRGREHAEAVLEGREPATQADVTKWNTLGANTSMSALEKARAEAVRLYTSGLSLREVGEQMQPPRSHEGVRLLLQAAGVEIRPQGVTLTSARKGEKAEAWTGGARDPGAGNLSRFGHAKIDVSQAIGLRPDHPAVTDGRTLFPSTVIAPADSPRLLVSGHNNPKLGKEVLRGDRTGWPIFHLTLEERATCPRSCAMWAACYGNAMHMARRHRADEDLMPRLRREIGVLAAKNPQGVLIRLHTLGDFFSVEYVAFWAEVLRDHPNVACFGYTARRIDDEDRTSSRIARALKVLTDGAWSRFAIRTSHVEAGPERSVVVDDAPLREDVVLCPAQTEATQACATCGVCWAAGSRSKTIAFLRHGMKRSRGPRTKQIAEAPNPPGVTIRSSVGNAKEAAAPTGSSPVVAASASTEAADGGPVEKVETRPAPSNGPELSARLPGLLRPPEPKPAPASTPVQAAPKAAPRPAPASRGRAIPRGARVENLGEGVQVIRMKPVTPGVVKHAKAYAERGMDIGELAEMFDVSPEALEKGLREAGWKL